MGNFLKKLCIILWSFISIFVYKNIIAISFYTSFMCKNVVDKSFYFERSGNIKKNLYKREGYLHWVQLATCLRSRLDLLVWSMGPF